MPKLHHQIDWSAKKSLALPKEFISRGGRKCPQKPDLVLVYDGHTSIMTWLKAHSQFSISFSFHCICYFLLEFYRSPWMFGTSWLSLLWHFPLLHNTVQRARRFWTVLQVCEYVVCYMCVRFWSLLIFPMSFSSLLTWNNHKPVHLPLPSSPNIFMRIDLSYYVISYVCIRNQTDESTFAMSCSYLFPSGMRDLCNFRLPYPNPLMTSILT